MASTITHGRKIKSYSELEDTHLNTNWEDVICSICLDFPHNGVLLQCTSFGKGCRPFMCDTGHTHSNCLERFKTAYGMSTAAKVTPTRNGAFGENSETIPSNHDTQPTCPLCRGHVTGWVVIDEARQYLNMKKRCCEEKQCPFVGNYLDLQMHGRLKHPHARPSEIDPARQLDWENFQQSSEIIDVLSTIHSEVPHGVVLGDYVIEYGDSDTVDEYEDFPGDDGGWWTSCILYQVFDNFRASRNRRRSRVGETRRERHRQSSYDASNPDDGSTTSAEIADYRNDETDDEFVGARAAAASSSSGVAPSRRSSRHRSYRRRQADEH